MLYKYELETIPHYLLESSYFRMSRQTNAGTGANNENENVRLSSIIRDDCFWFIQKNDFQK